MLDDSDSRILSLKLPESSINGGSNDLGARDISES